MKFNLTKPFDGAMQAIPEPDPWEGVVTFHIRPSFYGPFLRALREDAPKRPSIMQRALAKTGRKMALSQNPLAAPPPVKEGEEAPPPEPPADYRQIFTEAYREAVAETPEEDFFDAAAAVGEPLSVEKVSLLVESIDGLIDADTNEPCGIEALPALLADTATVPPGMRYAGTEVGAALRVWIVERARAAAAAIVQLKEEAEKNSERSSGSELVS